MEHVKLTKEYMQNISLETHIGADGVLHLDVPLDIKDSDLKITLSCETLNRAAEPKPHLNSMDMLEAVRSNADYRQWR